jgi:hypothetical protein
MNINDVEYKHLKFIVQTGTSISQNIAVEEQSP